MKRGGGEPLLDLEEAEKLYQLETNQSGSPERLFDRKWAHALLNQVLNSLRAEYRAAGRADRFEVLKLALIDRDDAAYQDLASRLGLSDSGFRAALFRFRRRYRELFRSAVTALVDDPEKVDEEVHYIISLLQER